LGAGGTSVAVGGTVGDADGVVGAGGTVVLVVTCCGDAVSCEPSAMTIAARRIIATAAPSINRQRRGVGLAVDGGAIGIGVRSGDSITRVPAGPTATGA
jgi:hypothetical protein